MNTHKSSTSFPLLALIVPAAFVTLAVVYYLGVPYLSRAKTEPLPVPAPTVISDPEPVIQVMPETPTYEHQQSEESAPAAAPKATQEPARPMLASAPAMSSTAYWHIVRSAADHLDLDPALLHAVILTESRYRPHAVSKRGAIGLMQLKPGAGARDAYRFLYGRRGTPTAEGLKRPDVNIWLGAGYIRMLHDEYLNDIPEPARSTMVLAAYNWGIGNVRRSLRLGEIPSTPSEAIAWIDRHSPEETQNYVRSVNQHQQQQIALNSHIGY